MENLTLKVGETIRLRVEKTWGDQAAIFLLHTPSIGQDEDMGGSLIVSSLGYEGHESEEGGGLEIVATNSYGWRFGELVTSAMRTNLGATCLPTSTSSASSVGHYKAKMEAGR